MSSSALILIYLISSVFWKWILSWGGAKWIEGWKSFFLISWLASGWSEEQIKLYALIVWIVQTIGLILKLYFLSQK